MALSIAREPRTPAPARELRTEDLEIRLLLEGIVQAYGHDFREYDPRELRARIRLQLESEGLESISQLQHLVLRDRLCLGRLLRALAPVGRDLFDPPGFWRLLRRKVIPVLRTYPSSRLWVAGAASGEEAYSMAILLAEEGLGSRSMVYATDLDESMVASARQGSLSARAFETGRRNYRLSGGRSSLQRYGTRVTGGMAIAGEVVGRIVFAAHSLVTDSSFNEFNLILCRNLLPLFSPALRERVLVLLHQSLGLFGYLGLGSRGLLESSPMADSYERFSPRNHLYRRLR